MENNLNIASNLKLIRELHDFKQEDVAYKLGLSQSAYSKIENGKVSVDINLLNRIAKFYNLSLTDLLNLNKQFIINNISQSQNNTISPDRITYNNNLTEELLREIFKQNKILTELLKKMSELNRKKS